MLVSIIKSEISKINSPVIETEDLKETINIFNRENSRNWKINMNEFSIEQQRELYLILITNGNYSANDVKGNTIACEKKREDAEKWMPIDKKITDNLFNSIEELKEYLLNEIKKYEAKIEVFKKDVETIEKTGKPPKRYFFEHNQSLLSLCNDKFEERCKDNDNNNNELYEAVDRFIGQTLRQFLK